MEAMLDSSWALTRPILWLALVGVLAVLVLRTVRKDRREYQRFKRYRSTARRQAMFRRWLRDSFLTFGGLSAALLLLAGSFVVPLLRELVGWPVLRDIRALVGANPAITALVVLALAIGLTVITVLAVREARRDGDELVVIGDIRSMLPRNRQELRLGALLSINAGIVEESMFRLALPAAIFGASGSAVAAVIGSVLLFGALHLYQRAAGIIGTAIVGALMMAVYVISGTIVVPIVLHALFDLRSLVVIPAGIFRAHTIDGRKHPYIPAPPRKPASAATVTTPADPAA